MNFFCVIPARAGSKRLPNKNLVELAGEPLICWTIKTAINSGLFDKVYVATDSAAIADVAKEVGAMVPELMPEGLCGDLIPSHLPCTHLLESHVLQTDFSSTFLVCLQPTSPLRSANDIVASVEKVSDGRFDFMLSATAIDPHYFHWALRDRDGDNFEPWFGDKYMVERPLLPHVLRPNGAIKIGRLASLKAAGNFFQDPLGVWEMPEERSVHVATQFDLDICELLLTKRAR